MTKSEFRIFQNFIYKLQTEMTSVVRYINYMNGDCSLSHNEERDKKYLEYANQSKNNILELLHDEEILKLYNIGFKKYMKEDIEKYNKVIWDKRKIKKVKIK